MSHQATNWAIQQRGISPGAKLVLWHLCDRYHPDHGCFPSQARLADDCEVSRASLNRYLLELEKAGLIQRVQRTDTKTKQQASTRYHFPFEDAVSQFETRTEAVSQNRGEPCLNSDQFRVSNRDTKQVSKPVREHGKARERGSKKLSFCEEWQPDDELRRWARSLGFTDPDIEHEVRVCAAHHGAKGASFVDLGSAWKTWMLRAKGFRDNEVRNAAPGAKGRSDAQALLNRVAARHGAWR